MDSKFIVDLNMREYETLRAEVNSTVARQYSLVNWGISAIVVIVVAIVGGWNKIISIPGMIHLILLFIIPAIMTIYVISWSHVITKINQLGSRLYEIENNISSAIRKDLIQKTFCIPPYEEINLYHFTVGWEHKLWKDGINLRVHTTINMVKLALAMIYVAVIFLSLLTMLSQKLNIRTICMISGSSIIFWAVVWILVFRYLRTRNIEVTLLNNAN